MLRSIAGGTLLVGLAAGADPAQARPAYHLMRQLTNITTGTIESVKVRSQKAETIAFVSDGDVMGPGTETVGRQIYMWRLQADGTGVTTRVTNLPGCESYDVARSTDTALSDRPEVIAFISTCDFDPAVGNADANPEVFFWEVELDRFHQITNTTAPVVNSQPYTSDSGRCLVFSSNGDLNNNIPSNQHYDSSHPGPGYSNPDGSTEVFLYGKLDNKVGYPYNGVVTQVSNGPLGTTSSHAVINGYWFARQCQTTAFQSDHDQLGNGFVGQGIYIYKMPMSSLEPITAAEIPMGFPNGNYRNPNISAASPFARGPHIVFESDPDLWRNESEGTNLFDWRDFHPRMTQFTNIGAGHAIRDPEVGDGGGVLTFSSTGELLHPEHELRTGELPPFNADANSEIFVLNGRRTVTQVTATTGCENVHPSLSDDGDHLGFLSNCDIIAGENPGGLRQVFLRSLVRADFPMLENGTCQQADGCCVFSRKLTTCYTALQGRKLRISRPNCIDKPKGCDN